MTAVLAAAPVPPIGSHQLLLLFGQIGLLLGAALLLGRLARRFGLPAVAGELTAGVILGPSLLGSIAPGLSAMVLPADPTQMHLLDAVAQLGVLLLVGLTGVHIDLPALRRRRSTTAAVSLGGLLVPLALGVGLGLHLPATMLGPGTDRGVFALFIGVALCVSAIPVIARTLQQMGLLHRDIGQLIMGAAAIDDIVGWLLLSVASALATTGMRAGNVVVAVGSVLAVLLVAATIARPVVRRALTVAVRSSDRTVPMAVVVVMMLLGAAGTHAVGMEAVVGAFLVGLLIGSSGVVDARHLAPLQAVVTGVLAPLYFTTAGLRMDLTALVRPDVLAIAVLVVAVACAGKLVGAYAGARIGRLGHWEAVAVGAGLNARGVIEVIVATVGLRIGILSTEMYTVIVLVAVVTSLMAPPALRAAVARSAGPTTAELARERALEPR